MKTGLYGLLFPSGKWYWGEGIYEQRCYSYKGLHCKKQKKLYNALEYYGFDSTKRVFYPMPKEMAVALEPLYIEFYDSYKNGYNGTEGGGNDMTGYKHNNESKLKMSKSLKGKKHSDDTKKKMSLAAKGKVVSDETREKLRQANLGKKLSDDTKNKIRLAHKGRKHTDESKANMSKSKLGNKNSLGYKPTEETKRKRGLAIKEGWRRRKMTKERQKND